MVGQIGVGKTSMLHALRSGKFQEKIPLTEGETIDVVIDFEVEPEYNDL